MAADLNPSPSSREVADRERFEALWQSLYAEVLAFCRRRVADPRAAEELCSETFAVAWRRLDSVPAAPRAWLFGVARKLVANHLRSEGRRRALIAKLESTAESVAPTVSSELPSARLKAAFDALRENDREALALTAWDGLKPTEAALVLGISPARFSVRLYRAKQRLRRRLGQSAQAGDGPGSRDPRVKQPTRLEVSD